MRTVFQTPNFRQELFPKAMPNFHTRAHPPPPPKKPNFIMLGADLLTSGCRSQPLTAILSYDFPYIFMFLGVKIFLLPGFSSILLILPPSLPFSFSRFLSHGLIHILSSLLRSHRIPVTQSQKHEDKFSASYLRVSSTLLANSKENNQYTKTVTTTTKFR